MPQLNDDEVDAMRDVVLKAEDFTNLVIRSRDLRDELFRKSPDAFEALLQLLDSIESINNLHPDWRHDKRLTL